ncbi:uncharacterized protein KY384_006856 [Bacidia gigantensis]|uniref:uncharacterized protein n=1 Tax=Bacidia gigantensis TaxID=2732470 RepID=UPI001D05B414|nr:uncharacterized protein KY384_006856 [Bacidia gigantensis]KAG8527940.1 hypothetical protein KY384_006856 [Bacidia gigantensis]
MSGLTIPLLLSFLLPLPARTLPQPAAPSPSLNSTTLSTIKQECVKTQEGLTYFPLPESDCQREIQWLRTHPKNIDISPSNLPLRINNAPESACAIYIFADDPTASGSTTTQELAKELDDIMTACHQSALGGQNPLLGTQNLGVKVGNSRNILQDGEDVAGQESVNQQVGALSGPTTPNYKREAGGMGVIRPPPPKPPGRASPTGVARPVGNGAPADGNEQVGALSGPTLPDYKE